MNARIVIKTVLICVSAFLILTSAGLYYVVSNYKIDTERKLEVVVAAAPIEAGAVINESMLGIRKIGESAFSSSMLLQTSDIVGKKALTSMNAGDYVRVYELLPKDQWHKNEDRVIVIGMDIEERLANLIKKGSLIDIRVFLNGTKTTPQTVLSKIKVEDVLDESGNSIGNEVQGKKAYIKIVLDETQRNRYYLASQSGKLLYELYCDSTQAAATEVFSVR